MADISHKFFVLLFVILMVSACAQNSNSDLNSIEETSIENTESTISGSFTSVEHPTCKNQNLVALPLDAEIDSNSIELTLSATPLCKIKLNFLISQFTGRIWLTRETQFAMEGTCALAGFLNSRSFSNSSYKISILTLDEPQTYEIDIGTSWCGQVRKRG